MLVPAAVGTAKPPRAAAAPQIVVPVKVPVQFEKVPPVTLNTIELAVGVDVSPKEMTPLLYIVAAQTSGVASVSVGVPMIPTLLPVSPVEAADADAPAAALGCKTVPTATARAALATGVETTDTNPAVSADTATSAMRCFIVFVDILFLSLVRIGVS
jgi:hypothetical protein